MELPRAKDNLDGTARAHRERPAADAVRAAGRAVLVRALGVAVLGVGHVALGRARLAVPRRVVVRAVPVDVLVAVDRVERLLEEALVHALLVLERPVVAVRVRLAQLAARARARHARVDAARARVPRRAVVRRRVGHDVGHARVAADRAAAVVRERVAAVEALVEAEREAIGVDHVLAAGVDRVVRRLVDGGEQPAQLLAVAAVRARADVLEVAHPNLLALELDLGAVGHHDRRGADHVLAVARAALVRREEEVLAADRHVGGLVRHEEAFDLNVVRAPRVLDVDVTVLI